MRRRLHWVVCKMGVHRWRYFIDGSICRGCDVCPRVQYDLPGPRVVDRNDSGAPTNRRKGWMS